MTIRDQAVAEVERLVALRDPAAPVHDRTQLAAYIAEWAMSQEPTEVEIEAAARAMWEQQEPERADTREQEHRARRKHYVGLAEDAVTAVRTLCTRRRAMTDHEPLQAAHDRAHAAVLRAVDRLLDRKDDQRDADARQRPGAQQETGDA